MKRLNRGLEQSKCSFKSGFLLLRISFLNQGDKGAAEHETDSRLTQAGSALAKAPRLARSTLPNYSLPTLSRPLLQVRPPEEGRLKTKWVTKEPWFSCFSN